MKSLIVEDDYITSQVLEEIMQSFGKCHIAEDGMKAIEMFTKSYEEGSPYEIILLDIMMPEFDGQEVLTKIRSYESQKGIFGLDGVKIIMTTALDDYENIKSAFHNQCEGYIVKPIEKDKIIAALTELDLLY